MTDSDSVLDRPDSASGIALSPHGAARRERMLDELTRDMRHIHQLRRRRRTVAAISAPLLVLVVGGLVLRNLLPGTNQPDPGAVVQGEAPTAPRPPVPLAPPAAVVITIVRTTATPAEQLVARREATLVSRIGDGELLDTLAALHRPTGLVRAGERTWLTRSVADL